MFLNGLNLIPLFHYQKLEDTYQTYKFLPSLIVSEKLLVKTLIYHINYV